MIEIYQIEKSFDKTKVINKLSCKIGKGSVYGLIGMNGSGKSTLFRMIMGIYYPEGGSIKIDGMETFSNEAIKKSMVFIPDDLFFFGGYTVLGMANYYASVYPKFDFEKLYNLCSGLQIDYKKQIQTFSKGMKRKVSIIMALSTNAEYFFFDETFDGLDAVARATVKKVMYEEVANKDATFIISSHNLRELEDICDQVGLLHDGGILFESDLNKLKTQMYKIQVAFKQETSVVESGFVLLNTKKAGSVFTYILKGEKEVINAYFNKLNPLVYDVLPLTLEEIFIYEMEVLGYDPRELTEIS